MSIIDALLLGIQASRSEAAVEIGHSGTSCRLRVRRARCVALSVFRLSVSQTRPPN